MEKLNFVNCIPSWDRGQILLYTDKIVIKCRFNCNCFKIPLKSEYYICKSNKFKFVTKGDLIDCLVTNNFNPRCDHYFLEDFVIDSDVQVTAIFGI